MGEPYAVRTPAVSNRSLTPRGMPSSRRALPPAHASLGGSRLLSRSFEAEGREPADGSVDRVDAGGHGIEHLDRRQAPRRELLQELLDAEL